MQLSISNIAWDSQHDQKIYSLMQKYGFCGLEIAPTRIIPENPYDQIDEIKEWQNYIRAEYNFHIPSMQSIWYGRQENLFSSEKEKDILLAYTRKAINFASVINCKNLVFGCPRNRNVPEGASEETALSFFRELGDYAYSQNTVIGLEANPPIYLTNFINDTAAALKFIKQVGSDGFKLNLDVGTIIHNQENISMLQDAATYINHVHISEPGLNPIKKRELHIELAEYLKQSAYKGYVSIEIGRQQELSCIEENMAYIKEIFS